jgi:TRAP-type uncharacterized transport system substrate-binding protein
MGGGKLGSTATAGGKGTASAAAAGAGSGTVAAPAAMGATGTKASIGTGLAGLGKSKFAMALVMLPLAPLALLGIGIYRWRKGREEKPPKPVQKPKVKMRRGSMLKGIGSKATVWFLALVSVVVAGLGAYVAYVNLRTEVITVAAGSAKAESYIIMTALKTVVERHYPRLKVVVHETGGSMDSIQRMERGEAQLLAMQADLPASPKANGVAVLYQDTFQLLVHKSAASAAAAAVVAKGTDATPAPAGGPVITRFQELKGKRIALPKAGGAYKAFLLVAGHFGLNESDFTFVGGDEDSAANAFLRDDADAIFQVRSIHNTGIAKLVNGGGVFLPIDHGDAIHAASPGDIPSFIPKGIYQGNPPVPAVDTPTVSTQRLLMASSDADEDAIYNITKVLMENRQEISNAIPDADRTVRSLIGNIMPPPIRTGLGPAIHPGAVAYYDRNKLSFISRYADLLGFIAAGFALFWLWIAEMRRSGLMRQKSLADTYNRKIVDLMEEARNATEEHQLPPVEKELRAMMATAIQDLNTDKLSDLSFQSLHTIWQVALTTVRERQAELAPKAPPVTIPATTPAAAESKGRWTFSNLLHK